jgi:hypothetical protein
MGESVFGFELRDGGRMRGRLIGMSDRIYAMRGGTLVAGADREKSNDPGRHSGAYSVERPGID